MVFEIKKGKKGALEMEYIVVAVIIVIALIVLVYFLVKLNIEGLGQDSACKLSILAKATAPAVWIKDPKGAIPIECVTDKKCIGGKCEGNFEGEKNVESVKLLGTNEQKTTLIEKTVADEFYNCWDTVGQGKLDLFGSSEDGKPRCMICSRIAFDKGIDKSITDSIDVNTYLEENKYLEKMGLIDKEKIELDDINIDTSQAPRFGTGNERKTNEVAVVFMQVSAEDPGESLVEYSLGLVGLKSAQIASRKALYSVSRTPIVGKTLYKKVIFPVRTVIKKGVAIAGRTVNIIGITVTASLIANDEIVSWGDRLVTASYCGTFEQGGSTGCSMVQIVPYDRDSINSICEIVEGEA